MKKTMVWILALGVLCAALLTGCGETPDSGNGNNTTDTPASGSDNAPETMLPDVSDGIVDDTDGIITDDDTGRTDNGPAGGTESGDTTAGGAPENGNTVTGTAANVRSNGMTIGTRAKAFQ